MVTAMCSLGQWAQHLRTLPTHCPWEAHPDVCHSSAGHGQTEQSCWCNFSQCFQHPLSVFSQGPSWFPGALVAWPGKGGGLGRAVGEDVAQPIVWGTWKWTRFHIDGKDNVVSPARDEVLLTWWSKTLNVRDNSMQAKKWRKCYRREMGEKNLLKARQAFTIKKIFAKETAEILTFSL